MLVNSYCEQSLCVKEAMGFNIKRSQVWVSAFPNAHPMEGQKDPRTWPVEVNSDELFNRGTMFSGEIRETKVF